MVREVEILEKLKCVSGIPKVLGHSISAAEEEPFVVLEWIDGIPLPGHFTETVSIDESAETTLTLCTIVQECHERGIIHRDIKPDNILIHSESNNLWLVDFGIGWTESEDDPFATEITQELGNRFLRLPELHGPDPNSKHDVRSDITFVCGVFFWLLTHSKPFQLINEKMEAPHVFQAKRFPKHVCGAHGFLGSSAAASGSRHAMFKKTTSMDTFQNGAQATDPSSSGVSDIAKEWISLAADLSKRRLGRYSAFSQGARSDRGPAWGLHARRGGRGGLPGPISRGQLRDVS